MRFDYTKGQSAKYLVSVYYGMLEDHYYFHYYKDAKKLFEDLKSKKEDLGGASVSINDLEKDIRKDYARI